MTKGKATKKQQPRRKATREEASAKLAAVRKRRAAREAEFRVMGQEFRAARDELIDSMVEQLRGAGEKLREKVTQMDRLVAAEDKPAAIVEGHDLKQAKDTIKVDDPLMTQAEIVEQRKRWPDAHDVGKLKAKANMVTLLGGFARFDKRTGDQEAAAMMFLSLHERAQMRSDSAIDYTQPQVNTSHKGDADRLLVSTEDARTKLAEVNVVLGNGAYDLLTQVILHCVSARSIAGAGASNRRVGHVADRVRGALGRCAVHWKLAGTIEKTKVRGWDDGSQVVYTGDVVNPKRTTMSR